MTAEEGRVLSCHLVWGVHWNWPRKNPLLLFSIRCGSLKWMIHGSVTDCCLRAQVSLGYVSLGSVLQCVAVCLPEASSQQVPDPDIRGA